MTVLRELREGAFDVLVGVNLLREGLDLPEVSLVAILDADKEGFLRSGTSLIQTIGRAARNVNAEVILYADKVTDSMQRAIEETNRRRVLQLEYNAKHNITPQTVRTAIGNGIEEEIAARKFVQEAAGLPAQDYVTEEYLEELQAEMLAAAQNLEFERAAQLRDRIAKLKASRGGLAAGEGAAGEGDKAATEVTENTENTKRRASGIIPLLFFLCDLCDLCLIYLAERSLKTISLKITSIGGPPWSWKAMIPSSGSSWRTTAVLNLLLEILVDGGLAVHLDGDVLADAFDG